LKAHVPQALEEHEVLPPIGGLLYKSLKNLYATIKKVINKIVATILSCVITKKY
jgi:hypothetical protein